MSGKKGENPQTNAGRCVLASELMHKRVSCYLFANQTQRPAFPHSAPRCPHATPNSNSRANLRPSETRNVTAVASIVYLLIYGLALAIS
jgi:hypothetical protein